MFLPDPDKLDLHRLQLMVERIHRGDRFHRGEGQTVARIYLMFGEVEAGDDDGRYLYVAENSLCAQWVARDFLELTCNVFPNMKDLVVLKSRDFYPDMIILPNDQVFRFVSVNRLIEQGAEMKYPPGMGVSGSRFDKVFFDVSSDKQHHLDVKNTDLIDILEYLQTTGAELV